MCDAEVLHAEKVLMQCTGCKAHAMLLRRAANTWRWRADESDMTHVNCVSSAKAKAGGVADLQQVYDAVTGGDKCN